MSDMQNLPGTGINREHYAKTSFYSDYNVIQNVCLTQPKNLIIDLLRGVFANDTVYTYKTDEYGYPLLRDLSELENPDDTTKILISDNYRHEVSFYPSIFVKSNGGNYKPISFNQNQSYKYSVVDVVDKYGKIIKQKTPTHTVYAGLWEMSFEITVQTKSHAELAEITEIVLMAIQYKGFNELRANGLVIKNISVSGESAEPYANDYIYTHSITVPTVSEWRVEIPIDNLIEKIIFYIDSDLIPISYNSAASSERVTLNYNELLKIASI